MVDNVFLALKNIIHQILLFGGDWCDCFLSAYILVDSSFYSYIFMSGISAGGCHLKTSLGCTCMTTLLMIGGTEIRLSVDLSLAVEKYSVCARFDYCF